EALERGDGLAVDSDRACFDVRNIGLCISERRAHTKAEEGECESDRSEIFQEQASTSMGARVTAARHRRFVGVRLFLKQLDELFGHRSGKLGSISNGDGSPIVTGDVMPDTDGDEFNRRVALDLVNDLAKMLLQIAAGIDRERRVVDR